MTNNYLVSVLVPIYGVEKFIEKCAKSLFEQTYNNLEFIFVDDCGSDNSIGLLENIILQYPQRANSVKIIRHQKNRGLAAARNTAVKNSSGEFLLHVDSDDYIELNTIELAVKKQIESNADIVSFGCFREYPNEIVEQILPSFSCNKDLCIALISKKINVGIWGRLIRKSLYTINGLQVEEGINMAEDYQITPKLAYYSKKVSTLDKSLYHYNLKNQSSYVNTITETKVRQSLRSFQIIYDFFVSKDSEYNKVVEKAKILIYSRLLINCIKSGNLSELYYELYNILLKFIDEKKIDIPYRYKIIFLIKNYSFLSALFKTIKWL